jgi:hypothetical protein
MKTYHLVSGGFDGASSQIRMVVEKEVSCTY